jgi:hypothetical protein
VGNEPSEHFKQLSFTANDYAVELLNKLNEMAGQDGFVNDKDLGPLMGMTLGALITHTILLINNAMGPDLARAHRDHLITHLENSKQWL